DTIAEERSPSWSRAPHWKCGIRGYSDRGFESLPLRPLAPTSRSDFCREYRYEMSGLRRRLVHECRCCRQRFEPLFGDRLTGNLADAVRSRLDPAERLVDAAQQFALQGVVLDRLFAVRDRARLIPLIADAAVAASTLQLTESGPDARFNVGAVFE